ncbi:MAG: A/G-specific adenine glycosylase [Gammaproteobacteria bacterium]
MSDFTRQLLAWHRHYGRHDLPWQQAVTPYRVWVSEIMLQQTQVRTVIPYFQRFMQRFSDVHSLAGADPDEVLHLWTGLGYYSRARNLHKAAQIVSAEFNGELPADMEQLVNLPGIGRSTAGAILSLSLNQAHPILDGNVKRILCRYHAISGWPGTRQVEKQLWQLAENHTPRRRVAAYNQAIMDLGATVCRRSRPLCETCPLGADCQAMREDLQQALPQKKPGKIVPVRQTGFAVIERDHGELLLQKRPPTGIWGGLWCFPECPLDSDIRHWVENRFGYEVDAVHYEAVIHHRFSHFRLDITPVRMKLTSAVNGIRESDDLYWYKPGEGNKPLGMAAPVKKLVENVVHTR